MRYHLVVPASCLYSTPRSKVTASWQAVGSTNAGIFLAVNCAYAWKSVDTYFIKSFCVLIESMFNSLSDLILVGSNVTDITKFGSIVLAVIKLQSITWSITSPAGIGTGTSVVSLESQLGKIAHNATIQYSVLLVKESCKCSSFSLSSEISNEYHLVANALCLIVEFQSNLQLSSHVDAQMIGVALGLMSTCSIVKVNGLIVFNCKYATLLLIASNVFLVISIFFVVLAGTSRLFSSTLFSVTGFSNAIAWSSTISSSVLLTIVHTVLLPLGALSAFKSRTNTFSPSMMFASPSCNVGAPVASKSTVGLSGNGCSLALRVIGWSVVSFR